VLRLKQPRSNLVAFRGSARMRSSQNTQFETKSMIDFIFIAVIALFFVAGGLYARWCEKL
jgi:hypothetical protein